ncbi:MAG: nickel/cobalt transporter [Dehalococcoidia bacterium]
MRALLVAVVALVVVGAVGAVRPQGAAAHPLGNFTVNRYSRVELTTGTARIRYVVDMAEIPAFQERPAIDASRDGRIDDGEAEAYGGRLAEQLRENLHLVVDGRPVALRTAAHELSFPEGQGELDTMRFAAWFEGPLPSLGGGASAEYRDDNFANRLGWKEIVVRGGPGVEVTGSSVADSDLSNELLAYPEDLLQSPPDQQRASFSVASGSGQELTGNPGGAVATARQQDRFTALITRELTVPVFLLSLLIAMGLGALHALGPGHGKTVVAAYLVGSRGTTKHAVFLGITVTLTHTSSVFALGLIVLFLSDFILPEQIFPWLSFASGAMIAVLGLALLIGRTRTLLAKRRGRQGTLPGQAGNREQGTGDAVVSGPAGSLASAHAHVHGTAGLHAHSRMRYHATEHEHGDVHEHEHDELAVHSHGGRAHSHLPPGADGGRVTWRSLLALGISGGLLPCPSALVVLLTAISIHRLGYGMLLILAFSVGLAGVLTAIGILLVHARRLFSRLPLDSALARVMPVLSAAVVTALGVAIAVRALTGGSNLSV